MGLHDGLPLSRWADPASLRIGARVVVRRRLSDDGPAGNHLTDVIGILESLDPLVVRRTTTAGAVRGAAVPEGTPPSPPLGERVEIPRHLVEVIKPLPAHPVRNSDIRAVEAATAEAFPGLSHTWIDGWLCRFSDGVTERSNSAAPLHPRCASEPVPVQAIHKAYQAHGLPTLILVPDRIARPTLNMPGQWERGPEILVMTRTCADLAGDITAVPCPESLASLGDVTWEVAERPREDWLSLYHFRGNPLPESTLRQLAQDINGHMGFGAIRIDGSTVAITRGTVTTSPDGRTWLGFSAVEVDPAFRRRGLATLLGKVMLEWGRSQGASDAYLQVISTNEPGRHLYHNLGFGEHHRHRYLRYLGE